MKKYMQIHAENTGSYMHIYHFSIKYWNDVSNTDMYTFDIDVSVSNTNYDDCYATSSVWQALLNTRARGRMQTAVYPERDCRKQWKIQDTLSRRATARAVSGGLRLLLVSTRPSPLRTWHWQDPISTTGGGSLKNARKMPVTTLVHTEHGPCFGLQNRCPLRVEPFCIF